MFQRVSFKRKNEYRVLISDSQLFSYFPAYNNAVL